MQEGNRRGIGIIRVSQVGDREPHRFTSPEDQQERIDGVRQVHHIGLIETLTEINVSGGAPLEKRPGLRKALEEVEAGRAEAIVVAYFDRLFRSIKVQAEVVERVEAAGGVLIAADMGEIGGNSAAQWMTASQLGVAAEYLRRSTAERVRGSQERAVKEGRAPFPLIPGFRRDATGKVELDPKTAPIVRRAFEMRADGASLPTIKRFLGEHGIRRSSLNSTHMMFRNRMVLGEIRWRGWRGSCPQLIDDELWERVQQTVGAPRGRNAKSERLLARLGVLRCGVCGGRMSATTKTNSRRVYPFYRCAAVDCRGATVGAEKVEAMVIDLVKQVLAAQHGRASSCSNVATLRQEADLAQRRLDRAIEAFDDFGEEPAAVAKLKRLRQARDEAIHAADRAARSQTALEISASKDWGLLTLAEQRDLIVALVEHVSVLPGRRPDRVEITTHAIPVAA